MNVFGRASEHYSAENMSAQGKQAAETNHILKALQMERRGGKRFRPFASAVAYCARQNWFFANGKGSEVTTVDAPLNLYQGIGEGVEARIVGGMASHNILLGSQVRLPNPPSHFGVDVGGFIDAIALDSSGKVAAYEVKTAASIPPSPKATHLSQAMTYAILGGIDNVYLIYVGRKVQDFPDPTPLVKVFKVDVNELLLEYATTLIMSCHSLNSKEAPQRPATFRKSLECQYCDFKERCWNEIDVKTMPSVVYNERYAEAEKTASELVAWRPSFYVQLLENCKSSVPGGTEDVLLKEIATAQKRANALKRHKL